MAKPTIDKSDLTTKARVRAAALDLVGEQGLDATTIRQVAAHAGVSVGVVQHHYKTKAELADDVRAWVLARLVDAAGAVSGARIDAVRPELAAFDDLMSGNPKLAAYTRRILIEATPNAKRWFAEALDQTVEQVREKTPDGLAARPEELRTVAAMLLVVTFGPVILGSALTDLLDCSVEEAQYRWRQVEDGMPITAALPRPR
ncbi:TetR/AcrR family transcriptional regulator [Mycobacterium intracellulare]|uniref:TetR/AcrR family transcriptional regulator n=1 Tax=Mycobacterium intracellulare TaxID=1767 RepID=UPI001EEE41A0|nr:TetR/AcrR family transcriptional regulator [Mycobacterium intracellulare]MEE3753158.1 TetR/AcrR family transcriptional regulator [Mycobacterium intracellulare]